VVRGGEEGEQAVVERGAAEGDARQVGGAQGRVVQRVDDHVDQLSGGGEDGAERGRDEGDERRVGGAAAERGLGADDVAGQRGRERARVPC
jgi:hypothetical protein